MDGGSHGRSTGDRPFFFEGAFGTYYDKRHHDGAPCELGNLRRPDAVARIHAEYIAAGADGIKTNTFGANIVNFPDRDLLRQILGSGWDIAQTAVRGTGVRLFADIGPIFAEDDGTDAAQEYVFLADEFLRLGADAFLFETMPEYDALVPAIRRIRSQAPAAAIAVSFAVMQDGYTARGLYYRDLIALARKDPDIDVCGFNCLCGPGHISRLIRDLPPDGKPLCAMPNSGYPSTVGGRTVYIDNVDYFSEKLRELRGLGVEYLGGCCGTTPEHIRTAVASIGSRRAPASGERAAGAQPAEAPAPGSGAPAAPQPNAFLEKLRSGRKVLAVEIDPPADTGADYFVGAARRAAAAGADIITVADSPLARSRADSVILAAKVRRETGVDVLPHMSCRDRNPIGIKASLLGASIENIRNVLAVTGDPVSSADKAEVRGMFSFNSFKLIAFIRRLNDDVFAQAPFGIAAALNVNAPSFGAELARALQKQESGADVFLTQPVFSDAAAENVIRAREALSARLLVGILPVAGYRNALFLNNEVPGIRIPDPFLARLREASEEEARRHVLDFGMEMILRTYDHADGFYLMTPLRKIDLVCDFLQEIRRIEQERGQAGAANGREAGRWT